VYCSLAGGYVAGMSPPMAKTGIMTPVGPWLVIYHANLDRYLCSTITCHFLMTSSPLFILILLMHVANFWEIFAAIRTPLKQNHWIDFYHYLMVVYMHCQHTFQYNQLEKCNGPLYDLFKGVIT